MELNNREKNNGKSKYKIFIAQLCKLIGVA